MSEQYQAFPVAFEVPEMIKKLFKQARAPKKEERLREELTEETFQADLPITTQQEYFIFSYVIKQIIDNTDNSYLGFGKQKSIQTGYNVYTEMPINGPFFVLDPDKNIIVFQFDYDQMGISIKSESTSIHKIYNAIIYQFENNNFYKFKNLEITNNGIKFHEPNKATFENVIVEEKLKEDIYLNSVYFLEKFEGSNGLIFHGPPGSGKSMLCTAIVNEAIQKNFTTIYITERIDLDFLREFIEKIVGDCVVIFEDIDSIAQSRKDTVNTGISNLLQLISGISDIKHKMLFIATTNYIEHLDEAIKSRPMRFNRKYFIDYPKPKEIDKLLDLYFQGIDIDRKICYGKNFAGAHIKELRRSFNLEKSMAGDMPDKEIFKKVVDIVCDNFELGTERSGKVGFV